MEELLVFSDNKTGEKVGMYYNAWLFIIRCILVKYGHKTAAEADEILKKHYYKKPANFYGVICISHETEYHWAMLGAYGEQYWLKGISADIPIDYDEWYENCIKDNHLNSLFEWF
ncbi:hypothetical protein [Prevotella aurantiaca]|uniref:hypothetical protein n=1 Tax=Prevotella aurantiaca TaxID=596085 RepID=UPI0028E9EAB1|nr:hypothetical protein [Prevotella aurantiaca]